MWPQVSHMAIWLHSGIPIAPIILSISDCLEPGSMFFNNLPAMNQIYVCHGQLPGMMKCYAYDGDECVAEYMNCNLFRTPYGPQAPRLSPDISR